MLQVFGYWRPHGSLDGLSAAQRLEFATQQCVHLDPTEGADLWHAFLPEVLTEDMGGFTLARMPRPAQLLIERLFEQAAFDRLYIRINRPVSDEAILVGVINGYEFLLLRWGSRITPFDEVKAQVYGSYRQQSIKRGILWAVVVGLLMSLLLAATTSMMLGHPFFRALTLAVPVALGIRSLREWRNFKARMDAFGKSALPAPTHEE